jgi:hypothetical protein
MVTAIELTNEAQLMESVLLGGDLSKLSPAQRVSYYNKVCSSMGLNPLTKPFDYINLNGKLTLYARKDATDQLRKINGVSIDDVDIVETEKQFIVKVKGHDRDGRADVEVGVVNKTDMRGDTANAQMKAVTKGKRRLTLSLCGLGWLDETEVQTIPDARPVAVAETGEIVDAPQIAPETINQETGQPTESVQLYRYNDAVIVNAVKKILDFDVKTATTTMYEAYKGGKVGATLTVAEAELFANALIAPK